MDFLYHAIGLCHDNHSHLDLLDALLWFGGVSPILIYLKLRGKVLLKKVMRNDNSIKR